jgi:hypothetical protein
MKFSFSLFVMLIAFTFSHAQNTYPWANIGNVGIGTTNPTAPLNVQGGGTSTDISNIGTTLTARFNTANPPIVLGVGYVSSDNPFMQAFNSATNSMRHLVLNPFGGNVGIGTATPNASLQIGNYAINSYNAVVIPGAYNFEQMRLGQIGNGNSALEFVNHKTDVLSYGIRFLVNVDSTPGLQLQYANPSTTYAALTYQTGLYMNLSGNVGIGTTNPQEALSVNGNIRSKQIKVETANWPDYVFKPKYKLRSLDEVRSFIDQNQHLPELPSKMEIERDGLDLGEIVKLQTKKIEELTLYLIEQQKEIVLIKEANKALEKMVLKKL